MIWQTHRALKGPDRFILLPARYVASCGVPRGYDPICESGFEADDEEEAISIAEAMGDTPCLGPPSGWEASHMQKRARGQSGKGQP